MYGGQENVGNDTVYENYSELRTVHCVAGCGRDLLQAGPEHRSEGIPDQVRHCTRVLSGTQYPYGLSNAINYPDFIEVLLANYPPRVFKFTRSKSST